MILWGKGEIAPDTASGYLLGQFCPNDGVNCGEADPGRQIPGYQCHGHTLWLIITLLTCMSPFGILIFQVQWFHDVWVAVVHKADRSYKEHVLILSAMATPISILMMQVGGLCLVDVLILNNLQLS